MGRNIICRNIILYFHGNIIGQKRTIRGVSGFIICIFPDQLSMEILRGKNGFVQYRDFMNISVFALLIVHGNIKWAFPDKLINPFSPLNISMDN